MVALHGQGVLHNVELTPNYMMWQRSSTVLPLQAGSGSGTPQGLDAGNLFVVWIEDSNFHAIAALCVYRVRRNPPYKY